MIQLEGCAIALQKSCLDSGVFFAPGMPFLRRTSNVEKTLFSVACQEVKRLQTLGRQESMSNKVRTPLTHLRWLTIGIFRNLNQWDFVLCLVHASSLLLTEHIPPFSSFSPNLTEEGLGFIEITSEVL
jgi:hypothetical protein